MMNGPNKPARYLLALLMWLLPLAATAFTPPSGQKSGIALIPHMSLMRDDSQALTIEEVAAPGQADKFAPVGPHLNAGFTSAAWWLRVPLDFEEPGSTWWLEFFPAVLDDIQVYAPRAGGGFELIQVGDTHPVAERQIRHRTLVLPLHGVSGEYYIRIRTTSTLQVRMTLWQPELFVAAHSNSDLILGAYYGIALLTVLFNLFIWVWLRDRLHLYYSTYLFIYVSAQYFVFGFAQLYLPGSASLLELLQKALNCVLFIATVLFFGTLFKFKANLLWLYHVMNGLAGFMAVIATATLFGWIVYPGELVGAVGIAGVLLILFAGFWLLWRGTSGILYYFIAFFASAVATLLYAITTIGLSNWLPWMDFIPMSASLLHILLLNAGLIRRFRQTERARNAAEQQALALVRESEQKLEYRVEERTRELVLTNSQLQREISIREALQQHLLSTLSAKHQTQKMQKEFFAMATHEFRTPLAVIDATAQRVLLQREDMRSPLEKIRRAVRRISNMIDTFLAEDKLETATPIARQRTCDLRDIVRAGISPDHCEGAYRIRAQLGETPVPIHCDCNLIELVLSNLVGNALKYSPEDTDIEVRTWPADGKACLEVEDHGSGIPAADLDRIFQKYTRLESAAGVEGTGFGLYVARLIAQRHGGDLSAQSEPGKGTCFRLVLPLYAEKKTD